MGIDVRDVAVVDSQSFYIDLLLVLLSLAVALGETQHRRMNYVAVRDFDFGNRVRGSRNVLAVAF
ncbi:MAG: hypothetical protein C0483_16380 [Pirellula sp.]|nr:hypothetical protein [Pirellula sp.]